MPVVWREQLATGNHLIDLDHKYLICLFNSIELAVSKDENVRFLKFYLQQLLDYTKEHFDREERLQISVNYPKYGEHKYEHQQIVTHLERVNTHLQKALAEIHDEEELHDVKELMDHDILTLAREWIVDHLVKSDKAMIDYIHKKGGGHHPHH